MNSELFICSVLGNKQERCIQIIPMKCFKCNFIVKHLYLTQYLFFGTIGIQNKSFSQIVTRA